MERIFFQQASIDLLSILCDGALCLGYQHRLAHSVVTPLWHGTVSLPTKTSFEYKYVVQKESGEVDWEGGENRSYTVPEGCEGSSVTVNDSWK